MPSPNPQIFTFSAAAPKKFKKMQTNINSDLVLGYYAHLIEDKIWFESYMLNKNCNLPDNTDD